MSENNIKNETTHGSQLESVMQAATTPDFQLDSVIKASSTNDFQLDSVMQSLHSYRQQALLFLDAGLAETENSTISMTGCKIYKILRMYVRVSDELYYEQFTRTINYELFTANY